METLAIRFVKIGKIEVDRAGKKVVVSVHPDATYDVHLIKDYSDVIDVKFLQNYAFIEKGDRMTGLRKDALMFGRNVTPALPFDHHSIPLEAFREYANHQTPKQTLAILDAAGEFLLDCLNRKFTVDITITPTTYNYKLRGVGKSPGRPRKKTCSK